MNIIHKTVVVNRNLRFVFEFLFFVNAVRIKESTRSMISTLKFDNKLECSLLKYTCVFVVSWPKLRNIKVPDHL